MDIYEHLKQAGKVARTSQLLKAGFSRTDIAHLLDRGAVQPRRRIFLVPGCDMDLAAAVQLNARLTCASAAPHYGLWLRNPPAHLHVACNQRSRHGVHPASVCALGHPVLPVAGVEDVVLHALSCLAPPASTALATSAIRLHGLPVELLKQQLRADRSAPGTIPQQ